MGVNYETQKRKLQFNYVLSWVLLVAAICAYSPLPWDPIPLFGPPALVTGTLLAVAWLWTRYKRYDYQVAAIISLAQSKNSKITVLDVMTDLGLRKNTAKKLMESLREDNTFQISRETEGRQEITYYILNKS